MIMVVEGSLLGIDQVARRFAIKASALRYYDEIGLLRPTLRRSGRRFYGLGELRRLTLIQLLQNTAKMSLTDIAEIVCSDADRDVRAILEARVATLQEQVEAARTAERYLAHRLTCPRTNPIDECPVLAEELEGRLRSFLQPSS